MWGFDGEFIAIEAFPLINAYTAKSGTVVRLGGTTLAQIPVLTGVESSMQGESDR
jgi:hypothetical protein